MLSKHTLTCIKCFMKGGQKLRISLFTWNDARRQLELLKSRFTWFMIVLMQFYLFGQFIFEAHQLWRFAGDPSEPISNYMKLVMQWLTRSMGMVITMDCILYGKSKVVLLNQILRLNGKFIGKSFFLLPEVKPPFKTVTF